MKTIAAIILLALAACSSSPPAPPVPPKDAPEWPANVPPLEPQTNDLIRPPTMGNS
jgi:PBP1b-binding outer membrane lipoprotein LpoB